MKVIVKECERGFLFKDGKFVRMLMPGKYYACFGKTIETSTYDLPVYCGLCGLEILMRDPEFVKSVDIADVPDGHIALHYKDGVFYDVLEAGKHAFWNFTEKHTFQIVDTSNVQVDPSIPTSVFYSMSQSHYLRYEVSDYQKALLYINNQYRGLLGPGIYYFWRNGSNVELRCVDTRLTQMSITGQELLTQDKVTIRVNFVCNYRITDCEKLVSEIGDFQEQLHVAAQLALRDYVGAHKLDEILENKDQMTAAVFEALKAKEKGLYVEISDAGVKDIILPGEIRDIMNTVLVAEKRAQANVIARREEVASTRSLLNTAKLMDENETLYRLKELEYVERICENVGNITLNGSGDLLAQLTAILHK